MMKTQIPNTTLDDFSEGRDNNFNLLRMIAATLVIFTHAFGITGHGQAEPLYQFSGLSFGSWAVDLFFVTSGYLICKSWHARQNLLRFLYARFLRIYPALWVSTLVIALIVGPLFTELRLKEYLLHLDTLKYLLENTTLLIKGVKTDLPGVFTAHPSADINSPLWTLPYELKMYLLLAALGWTGLLYRRGLTLALSMGAGILFALAYSRLVPELASWTEALRFVFFFFAGSSAWLYRKQIPLRASLLCAMVGGFIVFSFLTDNLAARRMALAVLTPYLVFWLACIPSGWIRHYNRLGDYSYGTYIYGYPVQQIIFALTGGAVLSNFILSFMVTLSLAAISWHFLESRALRLPMPDFLQRWSARPAMAVRGIQPE
ncbi:acyltransferase [Hahella sp. SMD15-11]|uniref:Acyltransferase n=1 Tax=Thermohahella caldifontis TaxID=3142973 RepID=A0AB39UY48_9GAMM